MMPLFPAYAFIALAKEVKDSARRNDPLAHASVPDHTLDYEALTPDPLFLSLRRIAQKIERWVEARDGRQLMVDRRTQPPVLVACPQPLAEPGDDLAA